METELTKMVRLVQVRIKELLADKEVQRFMLANIEPKDAQEYITKTAIATLIIPVDNR